MLQVQRWFGVTKNASRQIDSSYGTYVAARDNHNSL
jgi:hypothetical protein